MKTRHHRKDESGFCRGGSALPGCLSRQTEKEAEANITEAIVGWLSVMDKTKNKNTANMLRFPCERAAAPLP